MENVDAAFVAEVLRINARYTQEFIEAYGFCPFARRGREDGVISRSVLPQKDDDLEAASRVLDDLERSDPAAVVMGMLIFPRYEAGLRAFERFAERLKAAHLDRHGAGRAFVGVVFHPDWPLVLASAPALTGFLRRSPDPTLQFTRLSVLEELRRAQPAGPLGHGDRIRTDPFSPVMHQIAHANFDTVTGRGPAHFERLLADIAEDRQRSYAPFTSAAL